MAKILKFRRGTSDELNALSGEVAELFVDTTRNTLRVMDEAIMAGVIDEIV
jgi:hypothetical protein